MQSLIQQNSRLTEIMRKCQEEIIQLRKIGQQHQEQIDNLLKFNQRLLSIIQNQMPNKTISRTVSGGNLQPIDEAAGEREHQLIGNNNSSGELGQLINNIKQQRFMSSLQQHAMRDRVQHLQKQQVEHLKQEDKNYTHYDHHYNNNHNDNNGVYSNQQDKYKTINHLPIKININDQYQTQNQHSIQQQHQQHQYQYQQKYEYEQKYNQKQTQQPNKQQYLKFTNTQSYSPRSYQQDPQSDHNHNLNNNIQQQNQQNSNSMQQQNQRNSNSMQQQNYQQNNKNIQHYHNQNNFHNNQFNNDNPQQQINALLNNNDQYDEQQYNDQVIYREQKESLIDVPKLFKLQKGLNQHYHKELFHSIQDQKLLNINTNNNKHYLNTYNNTNKQPRKFSIPSQASQLMGKFSQAQTQRIPTNEQQLKQQFQCIRGMINQYREDFNLSEYLHLCEIIKNDLENDLRQIRQPNNQRQKVVINKERQCERLMVNVRQFNPIDNIVQIMKRLNVAKQTQKMVINRVTGQYQQQKNKDNTSSNVSIMARNK